MLDGSFFPFPPAVKAFTAIPPAARSDAAAKSVCLQDDETQRNCNEI